METQCIPTQLEFHALGKREVVGKFDGGNITSDAGGLLLRETEKRTGILSGFAKRFEDLKDPKLIEHTVAEMVAQRVYGLALCFWIEMIIRGHRAVGLVAVRLDVGVMRTETNGTG